jgi:hypothetical protein
MTAKKLTDVQEEWNKRINENHNQHSHKEISVKSIVISGNGKKKQLPEQSGQQDVLADTHNKDIDDISLCRSCFSMTHTIKGKCGKCNKIKGEKEKKENGKT